MVLEWRRHKWKYSFVLYTCLCTTLRLITDQRHVFCRLVCSWRISPIYRHEFDQFMVRFHSVFYIEKGLIWVLFLDLLLYRIQNYTPSVFTWEKHEILLISLFSPWFFVIKMLIVSIPITTVNNWPSERKITNSLIYGFLACNKVWLLSDLHILKELSHLLLW